MKNTVRNLQFPWLGLNFQFFSSSIMNKQFKFDKLALYH